MKTFKRTNWTTEEVIEILKGQKLVSPSGRNNEFVHSHNQGVDSCIDMFEDFQRPQEEFGAMGYCLEDQTIYHIGTIPPQ